MTADLCYDSVMPASSIPPLRLPPLRRQSMGRLVARAKQIGIPPEDYALQLVEDGLDLQRQAESTSFLEILTPVQQAAGAVDEAEVMRLVDRARGPRHGNRGGGSNGRPKQRR